MKHVIHHIVILIAVLFIAGYVVYFGYIRRSDDAANTLKEHCYGIIQWWKSQLNNGILEELNSVIQAAKAKARGNNTFEYYTAIIYLLTADLDFTKNQSCDYAILAIYPSVFMRNEN